MVIRLLAVVVPEREILERESMVVVVVNPFTIDVRRLVEVE